MNRYCSSTELHKNHVNKSNETQLTFMQLRDIHQYNQVQYNSFHNV